MCIYLYTDNLVIANLFIICKGWQTADWHFLVHDDSLYNKKWIKWNGPFLNTDKLFIKFDPYT